MEIRTDRLLLRRPTADDLDDVVAMHAEPEVERFIGRFDRPQVSDWLRESAAHWDEHGYGRLTAVELGTGRFLGRTGLRYWPQFGETEVGWTFRPDAWGHGYATEAGRACLHWAHRDFDFPYVTAMIRPDNERSRRVAERLGMKPLRDDVLMGEGVVVWATKEPGTAPGSSASAP